MDRADQLADLLGGFLLLFVSKNADYVLIFKYTRPNSRLYFYIYWVGLVLYDGLVVFTCKLECLQIRLCLNFFFFW